MINADLGPELEAYMQQLIESGRYSSRQEILTAGVRLLQQHDRIEAFKASIDRGIEDSENNRGRPMREVVSELLAKPDSRHKGS